MDFLSLFAKAKAELTESELHALMELIKAIVGLVIFIFIMKKRKKKKKEQEKAEQQWKGSDDGLPQ